MEDNNRQENASCGFAKPPDVFLAAHLVLALIFIFMRSHRRRNWLLSKVELCIVGGTTMLQVCFQKHTNIRCSLTEPVYRMVMDHAVTMAGCAVDDKKCFLQLNTSVKWAMLGIIAMLVVVQRQAASGEEDATDVPEQAVSEKAAFHVRTRKHRAQRPPSGLTCGLFDHCNNNNIRYIVNMKKSPRCAKRVHVESIDEIGDDFLDSSDSD